MAHGRLVLVAMVVTLAAPLEAQVIPLRTVPVASGDQFLMLPSSTSGMGGVRLAVDDLLGDPWTNPAKGAGVEEAVFVGTPTFYGISGAGGGGRTFPLAGLLSGRAFGGLAVALQQVENAPGGFVAQPWLDFWPPQGGGLANRFSRNLYATGYAGIRIAGAWSIGIGGSVSSLDAMDGVDLLYAGSERIDQSGSTKDVRIGIHHAGQRDRLELLLLHGRVDMEHDVSYAEWVIVPPDVNPTFVRRVEHNEDRTRTWGAHLAWDRSLAAPGWRIGASTTVNRKSHPKIPNYEIQDIPRDPGLTWAYEAAVGLARTIGETTVALDVAFQPIWSETWQEADTADVRISGGALQEGDRSIENDFLFTNVMLRWGVAHRIGQATLQGGVEVRSYAYSLDQANHVVQTRREQDETWMEWTPTFGLDFAFADVELGYSLRVTNGTGRPGTDTFFGAETAVTTLASGDFIVAPSGPLTLQPVSVTTHQLSVGIAVR